MRLFSWFLLPIAVKIVASAVSACSHGSYALPAAGCELSRKHSFHISFIWRLLFDCCHGNKGSTVFTFSQSLSVHQLTVLKKSHCRICRLTSCNGHWMLSSLCFTPILESALKHFWFFSATVPMVFSRSIFDEIKWLTSSFMQSSRLAASR